MKRLLLLLASISLVFGVVTGTPSRAEAHNWDVYSYWHCGATRLNSNDFITHSWPSDLAPGYVFYYCTSDWFGGGHKIQWWAVASVDTGESAVWIPYRFCYLGDPCAPEPS